MSVKFVLLSVNRIGTEDRRTGSREGGTRAETESSRKSQTRLPRTIRGVTMIINNSLLVGINFLERLHWGDLF